MKTWSLFLALVFAIWLKRRLTPRRLTPRWVEVDRKWTIETYGPGEMPADVQAQWENLKRTGIGPGHPDF